MTQVEQIKAEIERLKEKYRPLIWSEDPEKSKEGGYKIEALNELMLSLPEEQPSEDLGKAAEKYESDNTIQTYDGGGFSPMETKTLVEAFEAGAQWQKERMMKEN